MKIGIVRHKIADYGKWRAVFDADEGRRKSAGLTNPRVYRSADDKNEVVMIFDIADMKKAKEFTAAPELKDAMMKAGVVDMPTMFFLESA